MSDHECEDNEGWVAATPQYAGPNWRYSTWDILGISLTTVGGLFSVVGQGFNLLAQEFAAQANFSRQAKTLREAEAFEAAQRAAVAEELRALVDGPGEDVQ